MSKMLLDYTIDVTEDDWYLEHNDGGCNKELQFTLTNIDMPNRKEPVRNARSLSLSFGSSDYAEGPDIDEAPVHPEIDLLTEGSKKLRVRLIIEEIE